MDSKGHPFIERFRSLKLPGEKDADFSVRIGTPTSTWKAYGKGSLPKIDVVSTIAENAKVSVGWLMGESDHRNGTVNRSSAVSEEMVLIPMYDVRASAGAGSIVESEEQTGILGLKREMVRSLGVSSPGALRVLEAQGNSMEPTIRAGDLLLIDTGIDHIQGEGIYVFRWNGSLVVKRIRLTRKRGVELISDNGNLAEQIPESELPELHAAGRVLRVIRAV